MSKDIFKIVPLHEVEKIAIENAVAVCNGDKQQAAKLLQIGRTTIYRKLKEYEQGDKPCPTN